jgi:hypothetical protein
MRFHTDWRQTDGNIRDCTLEMDRRACESYNDAERARVMALPEDQKHWAVSKRRFGMTIGGMLGAATGSKFAGDLFAEGYIGNRGRAYGVRGGYLFQSETSDSTMPDAPRDGFGGWNIHPMAYFVPTNKLGAYVGPGIVFGTVKKDGNEASATALRVLGGLRYELFDLGFASWSVATELSYTQTVSSSDGLDYSGTAATFGAFATF